MPKALDIKGSICGHNVLVKPQSAIIKYTGIKVIWLGIMNASKTMPNKIFLPINLYLAKAYAAGIITANCMTIIVPVIRTEFLA
ncbi:hypothetical protein D3C73_1305650 [compost metagenome]